MIASSKNAYINKLKEMVKQYYNYTIHITIIMKLLMLNQKHLVIFFIQSNIKNGDHAAISKYEIYFQEVTSQIGQRNCL